MERKFLVVWIVVSLLCLPGIVSAGPYDDNFDDNETNESLWEYYTEDSNVSLDEINSRLEFQTDGLVEIVGDDIMAIYKSTWNVILDENFHMTVDYHYGLDSGQAGLSIGLENSDNLEFGMQAWNDDASKYYAAFLEEGEAVHYEKDDWVRTNDSGVLHIRYIYNSDILYFGAEGEDKDTIDNFRTTHNVTSLDVTLAGWVENADITSGNAYLDDFVITGHITPEPSSLLLLGMGLIGIAHGFARKKRGLCHGSP